MVGRLHSVFAVLLFACSVPAQVTFRSDVNLLSIPVRVTDKKDQDVRGLTIADFTVLEDGQPQQIAFFAAEEQPASLAVLLDSSSSMRKSGKLEQAKAALDKLLASALPGSQLFSGTFSTTMDFLAEVTPDGQVKAQLVKSHSPEGGTALYDAITEALCHLKTALYPRQVLVVVTDGADQHSRLKLDELIEVVRGSRAQVFLLGYFGEAEYEMYGEIGKAIPLQDGREIDNPLHSFDRLAKESGADSFHPTTETMLGRALQTIRENLSTQYLLGYYLKDSTKGFRRIEVKVRRHGMKVRARHGFSSPEGTSLASSTSQAGCAVSAAQHPYPFEKRLKIEARQQVYHEDFSDSSTGWPDRKGAYYRDGAYHMVHSLKREQEQERERERQPESVSSIADPGGRVMYGSSGVKAAKPSGSGPTQVGYGPWWEDFRASVTMELSRPAEGSNAAGMAFHMNESGYSAVLLSPNGTAFKVIRQPFYLQSTDLLNWTKVPGGGGSTGIIRLEVECRSTQIRVWANGVLAGSAQDDVYDDGMIGMVLLGDGHAIFRDLRVEEIKSAALR